MKTLLLLAALTAQISRADTTNLVEILPYVEKFSQALELGGFPQPLTTNEVTEFRVIRGAGLVLSRVFIQNHWQFGFNAKEGYISSFTDRNHSLTVLYKAEDLVPLLLPSKLTKKEAAALAERYLKRLGYDPSLAMPPTVKQWRWEPKQGEKGLLPIFMVNFPRKCDPESDLYFVEIDGLRERVNHFSTTNFPR